MLRRLKGWRSGADARAAADLQEAKARAARLGITEDRVLEEYRRIAFANVHRIVDWDDQGMRFKSSAELTEDDLAPVIEIIESASNHKPYRIKLYDKKGALDAIARYLGMLPKAPPAEEPSVEDDGEYPKDIIKRALARIAARAAKKPGDRQAARSQG